MKMKIKILFLLLSVLFINCTGDNIGSWTAMSPAGSETETSVFLLWDKVANAVSYRVAYNNGKRISSTKHTYLSVDGLEPDSEYGFEIIPLDVAGTPLKDASFVKIRTKAKTGIINIKDFGAKSGNGYINTVAIQKAIDVCPVGGIVYIPDGIFYSGALFLKSNMTLYLEEGAVLQGTTDLDEYPLIPNRFEGWEIRTPCALLNAGSIDRNQKNCLENLTIRGKGTIRGGGEKLAHQMKEAGGERNMGRLICFMNGKNITIEGLTIEESPCWTVHLIYCKNILCHNLIIHSDVIRGDGIDPDSSSDCYIYNCTFSNGDDCIAIKSGKNPEGNLIGIPTKNVRIVDCKFLKGHGISIGSEMSGGVSNVLIQDCVAGDLLNGLQIKATPERGGYVENIRVEDCSLQKIRLLTQLNYNNDGEAAKVLPVFKSMKFFNLNMTDAPSGQTLIEINGFDAPRHYTQDIFFKNILLPDKSTVQIRHCTDLTFENVCLPDNRKPVYEITESDRIIK